MKPVSEPERPEVGPLDQVRRIVLILGHSEGKIVQGSEMLDGLTIERNPLLSRTTPSSFPP